MVMLVDAVVLALIWSVVIISETLLLLLQQHGLHIIQLLWLIHEVDGALRFSVCIP